MNISEAKATDRKDLTGPALRTFFRIAEAWGLKEQEQMRLLGLDSRSTYQSWKRGAIAALDRKSTRLNSSHNPASRMPSSA
jgi:hypothetical protein